MTISIWFQIRSRQQRYFLPEWPAPHRWVLEVEEKANNFTVCWSCHKNVPNLPNGHEIIIIKYIRFSADTNDTLIPEGDLILQVCPHLPLWQSILFPWIVTWHVFSLPTVSLGDGERWTARSSLNEYIREAAGLSGTKVMCRESGCGCCAVTVTIPNPLGSNLSTVSINSVSLFGLLDYFSVCSFWTDFLSGLLGCFTEWL